jgi:hypothetical protein
MERDHEDKPGYRRLHRPDPPYPYDTPIARQAGMIRDGGVRRMRRVSNWTAAALIAGVAATTGYFAHASQTAAPTGGATTGTTGTAGTATAGTGAHKACPAAPVATSGGSGVTAAMPASGNCAGGSSGTVMPAWSGRDD